MYTIVYTLISLRSGLTSKFRGNIFRAKNMAGMAGRRWAPRPGYDTSINQ